MNQPAALFQSLAEGVVLAVKELFGADVDPQTVQIQNTRKEFDGHFTVVTFPFVKMARRSPEQVAEALGQYIQNKHEAVDAYSVVKGFLNLEISSSYWCAFLEETLAQEKYGFAKPGSKPMVMVEYSSPNTNKPLHLGHLRNNFLGYAVAEILAAVGHDVKKVQIINDRGIHICKSMVAWQRFGNGETPESSGIKGDHLVGKYYVAFDKAYKAQIKELVEGGAEQEAAEQQAELLVSAREMLRKWEDKDADTMALWNTMNSWVYAGFNQTYATMGVDFDHLYYESNTYLTGRDEVLAGVESGVFYKKDDGSIWVDLTDEGLDEKVLLRSDGTAVYMTQDIGTAILRYRDFPALSQQIYTVGNEQEYHFKVLFAILEKLGFENAQSNYHLSYGMVELPEGKMKSREGTVVDADDLMSEMRATAERITTELGKLDGVSDDEKQGLYRAIGHGSLKYFLLRVDPKKGMMFNPEESVDFTGNTGSYLQYNYVRTAAIARKYGTRPSGPFDIQDMSAEELDLLRKFHDFPYVLSEAAAGYNPSLLCNYGYELMKTYSSFYQNNPVLTADDADRVAFRVALSIKTGEILASALKLLGMEMPERM